MKVQTAILAGGCFWGVQELVRALPGVQGTVVGYTGGFTDNPSYDVVKGGRSGHAESVEIRFDPTQVTFGEILKFFFRLHDSTTLNQQGNDMGTQYRSAIFYNSEEQRVIAEQIRAEIDKSGKWKKRVVTEIVAASKFYPAEAFHQDYLQKHPDGYSCHYIRD